MTRTRSTLLSMVALAAALASAPSFSQQASDIQSASDQAYATYSRVVLGHTDVPVTASNKVETGSAFVPGSYAQYLINNGSTSEADALRQAAAIGEQPGVRALTRSAQHQTAQQVYERVVLGTPQS